MKNINLTGHFLIAMPAMTDPYFAKSVTYICEHNDEGAMGVVINRPIDMTMNKLFEQVDINLNDNPIANKTVYFGGPVQIDRGFVLHQPAGDWKSTIAVFGNTALTTSIDVLEAIAQGRGPEKLLVTLGYAGWAAGQLEIEMGENAWLTVAATDAIIFDTPNADKFNAAMSLLGVDLTQLSAAVGHA